MLVDGVEQKTKNGESTSAIVLIGKKTAKHISPGQRVTIQVRNPDAMP
jgi:hypothetical protein